MTIDQRPFKNSRTVLFIFEKTRKCVEYSYLSIEKCHSNHINILKVMQTKNLAIYYDKNTTNSISVSCIHLYSQ